MAPKPENPITDLTDLLGRTAKSIYTNAENSWYAWSGRQRGGNPQPPVMEPVTKLGRETARLAADISGATDVYNVLDDPNAGNIARVSLTAASYALPYAIGFRRTTVEAANVIGRATGDIVMEARMPGAFREGGRLFMANTAEGQVLASKRLMNPEQAKAARSGLEKIAENIGNTAERASRVVSGIVIQDKASRDAMRTAALIGGIRTERAINED